MNGSTGQLQIIDFNTPREGIELLIQVSNNQSSIPGHQSNFTSPSVKIVIFSLPPPPENNVPGRTRIKNIPPKFVNKIDEQVRWLWTDAEEIFGYKYPQIQDEDKESVQIECQFDDYLVKMVYLDTQDRDNLVLYISGVTKEHVGETLKVYITLTDNGIEEDRVKQSRTYEQRFEFYEAFNFTGNLIEDEENSNIEEDT